MKNRPSHSTRRARVTPLDHLRPGARPPAEPENGEAPEPAQQRPEERPIEGAQPAEPAEPITPGAGNAEAVRGKGTRSPRAVATRRHLEGSEQGPQ